ncbi:hypothetical protein [Tenacibaculum piscium]|uniref:hypothetical protein n=1 Tax=Tenacibaculum piscium TaxID=1458515 RepID=UPI000C7D7E7C|nr:hypothetical protein [Tenacibaculum piscium]MBE7629036.1 hypothetical protein [Tenacibaculum piscium]MBE7670480.1 hypothetical protein [Tenacibaculum piscium]MBE7684943.1 hypothetical protein [Tenacibaculum piscium]MBE7689646.1 hypothetical protein [Tenacibaculum piscium]
MKKVVTILKEFFILILFKQKRRKKKEEKTTKVVENKLKIEQEKTILIKNMVAKKIKELDFKEKLKS